jgi:23S rRNA (adenine2503-C2)-methyltransferase
MNGPMELHAPDPSAPQAMPSGVAGAGDVPATAAERPGLSGITLDELKAWLIAQSQPGYRLRQVGDWLWGRAATTAAEMRTLPADLRAAIDGAFRVTTLARTTVRPADRGLTEKALHELADGRLVESVLMRYAGRPGRRARATICISSQAGCAVGCPFCATGELGFGRDLDAAEIVDQVRFWRGRLEATGEHVTNVVFMGMGEPLLNLEPVLAAADAITDPRRFGLGGRHITISTSGVLPGIERLVALRPPWTLAVSLHAARPALRDLLVPLNRRYRAERVVDAAARYARATGRRVSYEYVMIDGTNDTPADASALAELLRGHAAHVNLIPMNPVAHTPWQPSRPDRIAAFAATLRAAGVGTTIRRNRGEEIGAACGQLAAEQAGEPAPEAVRARRERLVRDRAAALAQSR